VKFTTGGLLIETLVTVTFGCSAAHVAASAALEGALLLATWI
jgi:hypothetical protein